jgi:hypothetical protein
MPLHLGGQIGGLRERPRRSTRVDHDVLAIDAQQRRNRNQSSSSSRSGAPSRSSSVSSARRFALLAATAERVQVVIAVDDRGAFAERTHEPQHCRRLRAAVHDRRRTTACRGTART